MLKSYDYVLDGIKKSQERLFLPLAIIAIIASSFHFWPFAESKLWQMLNLSNLVCIATLLTITILLICSKTKKSVISSLPHISIFFYVAISFLSTAFAPDFYRSFSFVAKLIIVLIGGYMLFSMAATNTKAVEILYKVITITAVISVGCSLLTKFAGVEDNFGFFESPFKYGTYISILVSLSAIYLLAGEGLWQKLVGSTLIICTYLSLGSAGSFIAITAGLLSVVIFIRKKDVRLLISVSILLSISVLLITGTNYFEKVRGDFNLSENDGVNLKQRYIEWQAEINLLENRGITGTGAGCINDYRSSFYYRLPKANTLKAFDQNGWLAVAAETGIIGLITFCLVSVHYGFSAARLLLNVNPAKEPNAYKFAAANMAGFISACIANTFSSVQYNDVLIAFVLLLSLISAADRIWGDKQR